MLKLISLIQISYMKLVKKYPITKSEFVSKRNLNISINDLGVGSRKKIWWKCDKGYDHYWLVSPNQRTCGRKLRGCPVCAGKIVVVSNSL